MRNPGAELPCEIPKYPVDMAVGGTAVFINDDLGERVLVCGGYANDKIATDCHEFNGTSWSESNIQLPDGPWGKTAKLLPVAGNKMLYVIPGRRTNMVYENGEWTQGPIREVHKKNYIESSITDYNSTI